MVDGMIITFNCSITKAIHIKMLEFSLSSSFLFSRGIIQVDCGAEEEMRREKSSNSKSQTMNEKVKFMS